MEQTPRQMRISSGLRGVLIALLIGAFAWVGAAPGGSLTVSLLIGAALQAAVIILRRMVSPDYLPQAMNLFELLVDGATVLAFALGVYGGILRQAGAF
jgi:hypothetical protein